VVAQSASWAARAVGVFRDPLDVAFTNFGRIPALDAAKGRRLGWFFLTFPQGPMTPVSHDFEKCSSLSA
jgi:hypothetical protein